MAQTGSYLHYSDVIDGVEFTGMSDYTDGSYFAIDVLSGTNTDCNDLDKVLTLELNFWILDGTTSYEYYSSTVGFLTAAKHTCESRYKPTEFIDSDGAVILTDEDEVALADEFEELLADSEAITEDVGFTATITTSNLDGLTINWAGDSLPSVVTITYYDSSDTVVASETFEDSSSNYYELSGSNVASIQIMANSLTLPYRMLKINYVSFGKEIFLTGKYVRSAKIVNEMHLNSETLPASTLTFTFESEDGTVPFEYGAEIEAYGKAMSGDVLLIGTYYIDTVTRKTTTQFTVEAIDAVGMLSNRSSSLAFPQYMVWYFNYSSTSTYAISIPDIFMSGYDVDVSEAPSKVAQVAVMSAADPERTYRDWVRDFCFTLNTRCSTDGRSGFRMFSLDTDTDNAVVIAESRVYQGNTVDEAEAVDVSGCYGHQITTTSTYKSYFANTSTFDAWGTTYYDYQSYVTYTIDSGGNEVFTHAASGSTSTADVSASGCLTVLGIATSVSTTYDKDGVRDGDCAIRLYNFYQRTKTAKCKIVWGGERLGDLVTVPDPYGDTLTGNIQKMTFTLSNITAAEIEVLGLAGQ